MKNWIRFPSVYVELKEGEAPGPCLIAYRKEPWTLERDHAGRDVIVDYRKLLYVNLWLVVFEFTWTTRSIGFIRRVVNFTLAPFGLVWCSCTCHWPDMNDYNGGRGCGECRPVHDS